MVQRISKNINDKRQNNETVGESANLDKQLRFLRMLSQADSNPLGSFRHTPAIGIPIPLLLE